MGLEKLSFLSAIGDKKLQHHFQAHPIVVAVTLFCKNIAPYTRGTEVIGKEDRGACQHLILKALRTGPQKQQGNLDNSPHSIDIESGPSPEDRVRCCCIKSIKTMGSRQQNKCSPLGAIPTDPPVGVKIAHDGINV
ncbi:hypothetical protein DY000_02007062 [Brassica cretica]|nr:hypothetical protein DY000_02007062 [Brassica cretica]